MQAAPSRREETPKKGIGDGKAIAQTQYVAAPHKLQEFFAPASSFLRFVSKTMAWRLAWLRA